MQLILDLETWELPFLAIGVGFVAFAAWLLVLDFQSRMNRAFALYLFLDGARQFPRIFSRATPDGHALQELSSLMYVAVPFALLYFVLAYEERFGARRWRARALPPLLLAVSLLVAAYMYEPAWYGRGDQGEVGPLRLLVTWLNGLLPSIVALVFAREATRQPPGSPRQALLLASFAFAAAPLFSELHHLIPNLMTGGSVERAALAVSLFPLALAALHMGRVAWRADEDSLRRAARRYLASLALPVASVLVLAVAALTMRIDRTVALMSVMMGVWGLALPLLVTYALVKHRLFDVEVKLRWGISRGTLAAAFVAAFFVASEGAQLLLGQGNEWLGLVAAGGLVFALAPLQRAAERLAERAVPSADSDPRRELVATAPVGAARGDDRERRIFARAVRAALCDGPMTRAKEEHLAHAAVELGIPHPEAIRILSDVEEGRELA